MTFPHLKDRATIIINTTNIGHKLSGIGVYTLNLLRTLSQSKLKKSFLVILNRNANLHIKKIKFPQNFLLKWAPKYISPDYEFKGHLLRLCYINFLSLVYRKFLIFNPSQIEASIFGAKQIITIHDIIPLLFKKDHKKQYYFYKYYLKHAIKKAQALIVPCHHTKKLIISFYGLSADKIHVIYNGIQDTYLKEVNAYNPKKEKFILYVGRISPTKNIKGLLKAFKIIKDKIADYRLIIAGNGKENFLKNYYSSDLYDNRIIFKGYIYNHDEMINLYKNASLFVFPSYYEGFGLPPLEAMACGCPVVVSNVASLPEVCGDAAYYVDPYDVESIAEGIYKVLTDNTLRESLVQRGLERVKLFSWEKSAREHLRVFEEVLNS